VFADFGGVMTASKVTLNGHRSRKPRRIHTLSFELTPYLKLGADNLLAWRWIQPSGPTFHLRRQLDYLTFRGIYRDVELRVVPRTHCRRFRQTRARAFERVRGCGALLFDGRWTSHGHHGRASRRRPVVKTASTTVNAAAEYTM